MNIEFYFRGTEDEKFEFQNLFEYLLFKSLHGGGFLISPIIAFSNSRRYTNQLS